MTLAALANLRASSSNATVGAFADDAAIAIPAGGIGLSLGLLLGVLLVGRTSRVDKQNVMETIDDELVASGKEADKKSDELRTKAEQADGPKYKAMYKEMASYQRGKIEGLHVAIQRLRSTK